MGSRIALLAAGRAPLLLLLAACATSNGGSRGY